MPDDGLARPEHGDGGGRGPAGWCRTAEALFHAGRRDEAVAYCRRALPAAQDDAGLLRVCAWVFSNSTCHDDAARAYARILELSPDWVEGHRHLSGVLAASGHIEEAIAPAMTASDLAPHSAEFALHAGALLAGTARYREAARYLDRAAELAPEDPRVLCVRSAMHEALGESEAAVGLALRAAALHLDDSATIIHAAELLMRTGRTEAAAEILRQAGAISDEPRLLRVLSSAEMLCGRVETALAAADDAIDRAPDVAEYHIHRGHLLCQLGDLAAAAAAFDRAAALDPANRDVKRAQLSLYLNAGLVTEATAVGGDLLRRFPDDRDSAEAVLHLLAHRLDAIDGEYVVLHDGGARTPRPPRPPHRLLDRLRTQGRVINALMIRETRTRFGDSKLGYGWALLEPILHISLLSVTFAVLMHGQPPIGGHFFLFYYTGLIPYQVFVHASSGMSHAITANGPLLQLPLVTTFDVIAARGLLELATDIVVAVLLLLGFGAIGLDAFPGDLLGPATALLATAAFGCGLGYVNAVMTVLFRSWEKAYAQLTRILYFISGIFYVPAMMPDWARETLCWNPLLHAIDWFRAGFFAAYQPHWLDRSYLVIFAIATLLAGFAIERGLRRKLSAPL